MKLACDSLVTDDSALVQALALPRRGKDSRSLAMNSASIGEASFSGEMACLPALARSAVA